MKDLLIELEELVSKLDYLVNALIIIELPNKDEMNYQDWVELVLEGDSSVLN